MSEKLVFADKLEQLVCILFEKVGMNKVDALFCAKCMVNTNLWGIDSHGVLRLPIYLQRLKSKAINAAPSIKKIKEGKGPIHLLDGDSGVGYIVGRDCMDIAINAAKEYGIGFVLVNNSNHYGAAAIYARQAVAAGMIGFSTTNVIPNIGAKGNAKPSTGNNPIAMAAPLEEDFPFVLDISLSSVAGGKLLLAEKKGEKIPTDWAVTKEGLETDDPRAGFEGFLLPMGMHKGFGLSLFVDLMTGLLSGGPFLQGLRSMYKHPEQPSLTSHLFVAIDPSYFLSTEEYKMRIKDWVNMIKSTPMVNKSDSQIIPGEIEHRCEIKRMETGIPLPDDLIVELSAFCKEFSIDISEYIEA